MRIYVVPETLRLCYCIMHGIFFTIVFHQYQPHFNINLYQGLVDGLNDAACNCILKDDPSISKNRHDIPLWREGGELQIRCCADYWQQLHFLHRGNIDVRFQSKISYEWQNQRIVIILDFYGAK